MDSSFGGGEVAVVVVDDDDDDDVGVVFSIDVEEEKRMRIRSIVDANVWWLVSWRAGRSRVCRHSCHLFMTLLVDGSEDESDNTFKDKDRTKKGTQPTPTTPPLDEGGRRLLFVVFVVEK